MGTTKHGFVGRIIHAYRKRKALRILGHAKHYMWPTNSGANDEAIQLLTKKLWEVHDGR